MVDVSSLSDSSLRDLLLKIDKNAPPVNAQTRKILEMKVREHYGKTFVGLSNGDHSISPQKTTKLDNPTPSPRKVVSEHVTPPKAPIISSPVTPVYVPTSTPIVKFVERPSDRYEYIREGTPSYCRKSINAYRDSNYLDLKSDTPQYNVVDRPGFTPYAAKTLPSVNIPVVKGNKSNNRIKGGLLLALLAILIGVGMYFLLNWDPAYDNPMD